MTDANRNLAPDRSRSIRTGRRLTLVLALIAALSSSTLVVQQWSWDGQYPHRDLNYEKALLVINNKKENEYKRLAASGYLFDLVLDGVDAIRGFEKGANSEFRKDLAEMRRQIGNRAVGKK